MTPIELPAAGRIEMTANGSRPRKVLQGELMLTPVRPLLLHQDGRDIELYPGRSRLSPQHEAVIARPELFRACMPASEDKVTADRHRALLARAARNLGSETRRGSAAPSRPRWRLPGGRAHQEPWRLP